MDESPQLPPQAPRRETDSDLPRALERVLVFSALLIAAVLVAAAQTPWLYGALLAGYVGGDVGLIRLRGRRPDRPTRWTGHLRVAITLAFIVGVPLAIDPGPPVWILTLVSIFGCALQAERSRVRWLHQGLYVAAGTVSAALTTGAGVTTGAHGETAAGAVLVVTALLAQSFTDLLRERIRVSGEALRLSEIRCAELDSSIDASVSAGPAEPPAVSDRDDTPTAAAPVPTDPVERPVELNRPAPRAPPEGGRMLLAEDNALNRRVAGELLQALGYDVLLVENGLQAVEAVRSERFALILMDWHMPVMDGLKATQEIRALPVPQPVIVALTASTTEEERQRCLGAGMDDFLAKPFRMETLMEVVGRYLQPPDEAS